MPKLDQDKKMMERALELAAKAQDKTYPNPMVGAVVVKNNRVVGEGYHKRAGGAHAEVFALKQAGSKAKGATLYVTLEPCSHVGRTPPCVERILESGVKRVVVAMIDPNPLVCGKGIRRLRRNGLDVRVGVCRKQATVLNRVFLTRIQLQRPFVTVKVAQSLDGKIATYSGHSQWVSGPQARRWTHALRKQMDAMLVGVGTIIKDDPQLTYRGPGQQQADTLIRVVLDSKLRIPVKAKLFKSKSPIWIMTTKAAPEAKARKLRDQGAQVVRLPSFKGRVSMLAALRYLAMQEVSRLLIEGGGEVIASAFEAAAVDRLICVVAPKLVGGKDAPTAFDGQGVRSLNKAIQLKQVDSRRLGQDWIIEADVL